MNEFVNANNNTASTKSFDRNQSSLVSSVLWILSIVCVCLTITNLYLIVWVWNNLSLTAANSIDLLGRQSYIRLSGQLRSKHTLTAAHIKSIPEDDDDRRQDEHPSSSTLSLQSNQAIHLLGDSGQQQQPQSRATRPYLSIWPQKQTIQMAAAWSLRDADSGQTVMQCEPTAGDDSVCDLMATNKLERLKLASQKGSSVDFGGRSIQTGSVRTRQVHSPTNRLELRAIGKKIRLRSTTNSTNIIAFDSLRLGHSKSAVILDAEQIDLSNAVGMKTEAEQTTIKSGANSSNSLAPKNTPPNNGSSNSNNINNASTNYKLCICLPAGSSTEAPPTGADSNGIEATQSERSNEVIGAAHQRNGFIFGLRADLGMSCAKFSSVYC